ncbi:molybdate transport system substrate-binding protein ModA [Thermoanaerobacter kivui]|uniref:Molybdate transport system substrate-binding protein ModA n=1 Tax=Thermoanaerobacter kivui TaxID=2325 RepID=A0A097ATL1_THEKI|nr:molybdate ABC transporter substrate-binding protein [Thermoanaerobacter kivui]AIS53148.1 molybdate transport system substrate-binding protein ModA [Thermoanaerobacter kivui]
MKRKIWLLTIFTMLMFLISGCVNAGKTSNETSKIERANYTGQKLYLYAAASLKKPMDEVIFSFEKKTGAKVIPNYGASGELYSQIKSGQPCDIYFPADWLYVDKLKNDGMLKTSQKFLEDVVVLVVSEKGKSKVQKVDDLLKPNVAVGVADPKAPIGVYTETALKKMKLWEKLILSGNLKARPVTVNQVAMMVKNDELDAGFVYSSVAKAFGLEYVQIIPKEYTGEIVYGAAIIKGGNEKLAQEFLNFVNKNIEKFTKYGWKVAKK